MFKCEYDFIFPTYNQKGKSSGWLMFTIMLLRRLDTFIVFTHIDLWLGWISSHKCLLGDSNKFVFI